jgi:Ulp1 family protease
MKERKKIDLNRLSEWETELIENIPIQRNDSDCRVFTCQAAEYLSRGAELTFKQKHTSCFRKMMNDDV